jgi:hypothetical protein
MAGASDLGATLPPPGLAAEIEVAVKAAIASSFAAAFRMVLVCCAALAFGGSLVAALTIGRPAPRPL